jgi:hypothetical protein
MGVLYSQKFVSYLWLLHACISNEERSDFITYILETDPELDYGECNRLIDEKYRLNVIEIDRRFPDVADVAEMDYFKVNFG